MASTASRPHPLEVETEDLGSCLHRVRVHVPAARVRQEFDHTYQAAAKQVKLPGFRPGKVPAEVLRKRLGDSLAEDARDHLFEHVVGEALHQAGLHSLRVLDLRPEDHKVSEDADLDFEFQVECAPHIDLPPWEEVKVEAQPVEPDEKQLHETLEAMGREHPRFDEAAGQSLDEEHLAEADLAYFKDEEEGPSATDLKLSLSSPLYGTSPEAYAEALKGIEAGAEIQLPVEFNEGFSKEEWVGGKGEARLKVKRIVKPRPGTPAEIAGELKLADEDQLNVKLREGLTRENEVRERSRQAYEALELICGLRPFEVPARLLEEEIEASVNGHAERLEKEGGLSAEEAAARAGQAREEIAADSERRLRHYFLVRRIAEAEKVRVTEGDLEQAFRGLGARHQADPRAVRAYYEEKDMLRDLQREILEGKVRDQVRRKAAIEPTPSAD